jgi:septum formation protein
MVEDLAEQKAMAVYDLFIKNHTTSEPLLPFICAADTLVFFQQKPMGKPVDQEDAAAMLSLLSGKTHEVMTGVCLLKKTYDGSWEKRLFHVTSHVTFASIREDDLVCYLATRDYEDKAGAYGIQGEAQTFIKSVQGSYSNVVGLPLWELTHEMETWFLEKGELRSLSESWRDLFIGKEL